MPLLASGCSILFSAEKAPQDDAAQAECNGCLTTTGQCEDPPTKQNCGPERGLCTETCGPSADACGNGLCLCGDSVACGAGLKCVGRTCECDSDTCPGCCSATGICRAGNISLACGEGGATCECCDPLNTNTCNAVSECACGLNEPCGEGLRCDESGACVCDSLSGCDGCCAGNVCLPENVIDECGVAGAACTSCAGAGDCVQGVCSSCVAKCDGVGGALPDDPGGCCSGVDCFLAVDGNPTACNGLEGNACVACRISADACSPQGECICGDGKGELDQQCLDIACKCTPASCPNGCCDAADICHESSDTTCGGGGETCGACDSCQACDDIGVRVCNADSCPNGCCDSSDTCIAVGNEGNSCGTVDGFDCMDKVYLSNQCLDMPAPI